MADVDGRKWCRPPPATGTIPWINSYAAVESLDRLRSNQLKMTQKLIGNMLGISDTEVDAAVVALEKAGLIAYVGGSRSAR